MLHRPSAGHAAAMSPPEFEDGIAADRNADQRRAAHIGIVHHAGDVGGMFLHRGRTFANLGFAVPAQIGHDESIARRQRVGDRQPEFMVHGKRMQQDHRADRRRATSRQISASPLLTRWEGDALHARD